MSWQDDTWEERLKRTIFAVEATSFEQLMLWRDHAHNSPNRIPKFPVIEWEQINSGWGVTVGKLGKRPVVISVSWCKLDGFLVMFWYACSQVSDSKQVDKWFEKNFPVRYDNGHRPATCDAMNFGHCISALREAKTKRDAER